MLCCNLDKYGIHNLQLIKERSQSKVKMINMPNKNAKINSNA